MIVLLKPPLISVVVCTYNRAALLANCLQSLAEQTLNPHSFEVIVVNNNSTDYTKQVAKGYLDKYNNFRIVDEHRQGLSHARNRGWQEAQGKYVAFIDDDANATLDWLELIIHAFENVCPQPASVGGEICPRFEAPPPSWFTEDLELRSWGDKAGFLSPPVSQFGFSGSNMAFPKHVIEDFGGFNTSFGMKGNEIGLGEEAHLYFRMHQSHAPLWYDPAIRVHHWTPVRNTTMLYRAKRAFCAGRSRARIVGSTFYSLGMLCELIRLPSFVFVSIASICLGRGVRCAELVKFVQGLCNRIGFCAGSM
jgi:glycosyltransferase involved in cell wall biosynthesis